MANDITIENSATPYLAKLEYTEGTPVTAADVANWCEIINNNFGKLIAAPFIKGDNGESVELQPFDTYSDNDSKFTAVGKEMLRAIYSPYCDTDNSFKTAFEALLASDVEINDLRDLLDNYNFLEPITVNDGENDTNIYSCDFLEDNTVNVFKSFKRKTDGTEDVVYVSAGMFMFVDNRTRYVDTISRENDKIFIDLGCCVVVSCINDEWSANRINAFPTVYYDDELKCWCWYLNNIKTGIPAQGVKGDNGDGVYAYLCEGDKPQGATAIKIQKILAPTAADSSALPLTTMNDGDFVACWYKDKSETYNNFAFGIVYTYNHEYFISNASASTYNFEKIFANINLQSALNEIATSSNSLRGLYLKDAANSVYHMLWAKDNSGTSELNITPTSSSYITGYSTTEPLAELGHTLKINYSKIDANGGILNIGKDGSTVTIGGNGASTTVLGGLSSAELNIYTDHDSVNTGRIELDPDSYIDFGNLLDSPNEYDDTKALADFTTKITGANTVFENSPIDIPATYDDKTFISGVFKTSGSATDGAITRSYTAYYAWKRQGEIVDVTGNLIFQNTSPSEANSILTNKSSNKYTFGLALPVRKYDGDYYLGFPIANEYTTEMTVGSANLIYTTSSDNIITTHIHPGFVELCNIAGDISSTNDGRRSFRIEPCMESSLSGTLKVINFSFTYLLKGNANF